MQEACQGPASCRDTNMHHPTSVRRGTSLNLLPGKSQTSVLPSFASCLQLFHPEPGASLGSRPWGCPEASTMAGWMPYLTTFWLRAGRGRWPVLGYARLRAELNGQARARLFSNHLGKACSGNKKLFHLPVIRECKWGLGNPRPAWPMRSAGLWTVFLRERMMQSKWNKRSTLVF